MPASLPVDPFCNIVVTKTIDSGTFAATAKGLTLTLKGEQGPVEEFRR